MNVMELSGLAFVAGMPTAWAFCRYLEAVATRSALAAAGWDMVIIGLGSICSLTLWSLSGDSPLVFIGWMLGNAAGTYAEVLATKRRES